MESLLEAGMETSMRISLWNRCLECHAMQQSINFLFLVGREREEKKARNVFQSRADRNES